MASKSCIWEEDWEGNWEADCDNMFCFIDGGPRDNEMKFCCYCGKKLEEKRYVESTPKEA